MPEWNLADLYAGLDDPAIKRDLDRADADCVAFEEVYKGKLTEMAASAQAGAAKTAQAPARTMLESVIFDMSTSPMVKLNVARA